MKTDTCLKCVKKCPEGLEGGRRGRGKEGKGEERGGEERGRRGEEENKLSNLFVLPRTHAHTGTHTQAHTPPGSAGRVLLCGGQCVCV